MTNVKTAKVEIAMSVILAQGPCMDMSALPNVSDSSLGMWSLQISFPLHFGTAAAHKLQWKFPFGITLVLVALW